MSLEELSPRKEKHLRVNTGIMDLTSTTPETIAAYDKIKINCGLCLVTAKTKQLLSQSLFAVNTGSIFEVETDEGIKVQTINGFKKISADFPEPEEPTVLVINGAMIIEDSHKKKLDQYKAIVLNGATLHPKSFDTSNFHVNGALIPYPDGATLILQRLELTNSFIKSAIPGTTYFVQGIPADLKGLNDIGTGNMDALLMSTGLRAIEPLDLEALKNRNIRFYTNWVTTLEENAEQLMQMVDGYIGTTIIPAGYRVMPGGSDMIAIRGFGKRVYVEGDLEINAKDAGALSAIEQLQVMGHVRLAESAADIFFEKCSKYGDLTVYQGEWVNLNNTDYTISKESLEEMEEGATFNFKNSTIQISPDVPAKLLSAKIYNIFLNNSDLTISLHQQNTIQKLSNSKNSEIHIREIEATKQPEPEPQQQDFIETKINTACYKL